jgi:DNA-binding NarL/FixJ family response regulator
MNEEIISMSRCGFSIEEIAEELDIDEALVMEVLEDEFFN